MRVLVTGGAGFVGSWVVPILVSDGHEVTVVDNLSTGSVTNLCPSCYFVKQDVCQEISGLFRETKPEVVVHLAAQVSVPNSVEDPLHDLNVNIGGTVNIMRCAAKVGTRKIVFMSSAAVYGIPETLPIQEASPTSTVSPYGVSKLAAENYIRLLGELSGVAHTILRPANIYGPRQKTEGDGAVVPAFLNRFLVGRDPVIHGDGTQTRDFVYVTDVARAVFKALDRADGLTLNISSGEPTSIEQLWELMADHLSWKSPAVYGPFRIGDIPHSVMTNREAQRHLGWVPQVSLPLGLLDTILWATTSQAAAAQEF